MSDIEELKSEAASLGIKHNAQIGVDKLKVKIDEHYEAQETSGPALAATIKKQEATVAEVKVEPKSTNKALDTRKQREAAARKTRIISIVDNDQRVNNHTSTCLVNCSNQFFDLGTRVLPLNEKIEVAQGHIDVLKEVMIPLHIRNTKTGLTNTRLRTRYNINFEDSK